MPKANLIPTRKWSKTLSTIIRNHQHEDGQSYRIIKFGESNLRYYPWDIPTHQASTVDCRIFTQTSLEDCISASNLEELQHLHMSLTEHEETNSAPDGMLQETDAHVEVETDENEPESKPKSNKRKWLFGLGASTVLAGIITYVIKKI